MTFDFEAPVAVGRAACRIFVSVGDFFEDVGNVHIWVLTPEQYNIQKTKEALPGIHWLPNNRVAMMMRDGSLVGIDAIDDGVQVNFEADYAERKTVSFVATTSGTWGVLIDGTTDVGVSVEEC